MKVVGSIARKVRSRIAPGSEEHNGKPADDLRLKRLSKRVHTAHSRIKVHEGQFRNQRKQLQALRIRLGGTRAEVHQLRVQTEGLLRLASAMIAAHPEPQTFLSEAMLRGGPHYARARDSQLLQARLLIDAELPLEADHLVRTGELLNHLPLRLLRIAARQLRDRGYLARSLMYSHASLSHGIDSDAVAYRFRRGQERVLTGEFKPSVAHQPIAPAQQRVLHVAAHGIPDRQTGYTIRTHQTVMAQRRQGIDAHVVLQPGVVDGPAGTVQVGDVVYHRILAPPRTQAPSDEWLQAYTESLLTLVVDLRPAVIHAHSDFHNLLAARAVGDATGIPVIYEARGFWEETWLSGAAKSHQWPGLEPLDYLDGTYGALPEAYTWRRAREREACRVADHVITLAEVMREEIAASGVPVEHISLAPNAVDVEQFPLLDRDASLAAEYGIAPATVVIGYVSSLVEYEGIDDLIRGFAMLQERTAQSVRLLIVGDGPAGDSLKELVRHLACPNVTFAGRVSHSQVDRFYSLIDVFVVPRKPARVCHLVTPLKPFEAFSTGRAVVMSDVRALAEIAEESQAASLFHAGDPDSLAETLADLVESPERRAYFSRVGAEWVRSSRTWAANAETYARVYQTLRL